MIESAISRNIQIGQGEKTYIDKLLSKSDIDTIKGYMTKEKLGRKDLLGMLYGCLSAEQKLLNYSAWDRYIILKFFVWIREFIKIAEIQYDYQDFLKEKKIKLSDRTKRLLKNNEAMIEHNAKFLIDLFLLIGRSSLSVGATGILELIKQKFEIAYPNLPGASIDQPKRSIWGTKSK